MEETLPVYFPKDFLSEAHKSFPKSFSNTCLCLGERDGSTVFTLHNAFSYECVWFAFFVLSDFFVSFVSLFSVFGFYF